MPRAVVIPWLLAALSCGPAGSSPEETEPPAPDTCDLGATCDGQTGLCEPLPLCSAANPCDLGTSSVTEGLRSPTCKTTSLATARGRGKFDDGPPRTWTDAANGEARAACWHVPSAASPAKPLPLVLFFHGAGGSADDVYNATLLVQASETAVLSEDPGRRGYVLIADQGRNVHYPDASQVGHHDTLFRRFPENPDVRNADWLIDQAVASGVVDPARIFVMGWSNGGFFAQMYGILRHDAPTPGGHRVAAVVAYTAADPYQGPSVEENEACTLPYPTTDLPIHLVHRSCDIVACDEEQARIMSLAPGFVVGPWVETLRTTLGADQVADLIVDTDGKRVAACMATPPCTELIGLQNHIRWPDGVADGGTNHQPAMFEFLRAHPRE